jgi:hypothetical protein
MAVIGLLGGNQTQYNLVEFVSKNITVFERTLRTQPDSVKRRLLAELERLFGLRL